MREIRICPRIVGASPSSLYSPAELKNSAARIVATGLSAGMLFATAMICLGLWP